MSKTHTTKGGTVLPLIQSKGGKDYLQVAHRLVWFREERPDWSITTDILKLDDKYAIVKATVHTPNGQIMSTAHKREDAGHFGDFMEKAETGAIGRALAMVGFGTQFCEEDFDEGERIVDSPQDTKKSDKQTTFTNEKANGAKNGSAAKEL